MYFKDIYRNMRRATFYVIWAFLMASVLVSCHQSHKKELDLAYALAKSNPDSALVFLNHIDQVKLSEEDMAKYALTYYMAQDKSGLDVDNDSLIRIAYDWYGEHQDDSLYATALYYMGEYYRLVDSIVLAKSCLEKSYNLANKIDNVYLISLSLDKLVRVEGELNPHKAMKLARKLVEFYDKHPQLSLNNKVYARLRLCTSLLDIGCLRSALEENLLALNDAKVLKDKELLSDVCQDLAFVYGELGKKDSSLYYAKIASSQRKPEDISCQLELAFAFYDVDSLNEMYAIINNLSPKSQEDKNRILYLKILGAIKNKNANLAICYTDSVCDNYEVAYRKAIQGKYNYYTSYLNNVREKAELKGKSEMQKWVFMLSLLLLISVLLFIVYTYFTSKKHAVIKIQQEKKLAATKLAHEQELHEQEILMADKLHKEEIAHKEAQLVTMRSYLIKKIEIVDKLNSLGEKGIKHLVLSEDDWMELEVFLESVEDLFVTRLKKQHSNLTRNDIRLMMLLRLKLPQKSLASIYCISEKAIKQKLFLYKERVGIKNEHISLRKYIETF